MPQSINSICVVGAGTMGRGIALTTALNGFYTLLFDISTEALENAKIAIQKDLQYLVDKQKLNADKRESVYSHIQFVNDTNDCLANVVIEAIVEKLEAKISILNQLAEVNHAEVVFATNTSSISISEIQSRVIHPERVVGMHFFNPAQVMKLVEVVKGNQTNEESVQIIYGLCSQLNKTPVKCKDAPGFIVNRVARQYYLESMKLVECGIASIETVDEVMEACGFKMGPFKLMDLIGMDINLAVTQSLFEAFNGEERFAPSPIQIKKIEKGELGKKSGRGFYVYG